jgi:hypothetical protein
MKFLHGLKPDDFCKIPKDEWEKRNETTMQLTELPPKNMVMSGLYGKVAKSI